MSNFQITLQDRSIEQIEGADAYQQEGSMTTFFQTGSGRNVVDTWSTRVASFRTSEVVIIRRLPVATRHERAVAAQEPLAVSRSCRSTDGAVSRAMLA